MVGRVWFGQNFLSLVLKELKFDQLITEQWSSSSYMTCFILYFFRIVFNFGPWRQSNFSSIKQFKIQTTIAQTTYLDQWTGTKALLWLFTEEQGNLEIIKNENWPKTFSWCYKNKCQNNIYSEHPPTKISENSFALTIKKFFPFH